MKAQTKPFALCIDNTGYRVSLIPGKVYQILSDQRAARITFTIQVILYLSISPAVKKKILALQGAA